MRKNLAVIAAFLLLVAVGFYFQKPIGDNLAQFFWNKYHNERLALFFDKYNAGLAMNIGNHYFGMSPAFDKSSSSAKAMADKSMGRYDLDKAEAAYREAITINPQILWGHYQLARVYFIKRNFNQALEAINQELKFNPENLRSLYVRGLIYAYSGDLKKSEEDFRNFVNWAPKEWAGYNDWAWILLKGGKYGEGEKVINQAFREVLEAQNNPWLWNSLGVAELNLKEYRKAAASFKKADFLAQKLTIDDWQRSYPGDDPGQAEGGLKVFRESIRENLKKTQIVDKSL